MIEEWICLGNDRSVSFHSDHLDMEFLEAGRWTNGLKV